MDQTYDTPTSVPYNFMKSTHKRSLKRRNRKIKQEIISLQKSGDTIIPHASFSRVVHEALEQHGEYSIRSEAMRALQCAAEEHVTEMFQNANNIARFTGRETVSRKDLIFVAPEAAAFGEEHSEHPEALPAQ